MGYWGKIIGGFAGFAMGGPFGAVLGAALGHAADSGVMQGGAFSSGGFPFGSTSFGGFAPARLAAMLGGRDQLFAMGVVVLSAKLAKCDGPVKRAEIDAFKRHFRIPPESVRDVGRLFDQARDSPEGYEDYARQLGEAFSDNLGMLEDVLVALFAIARADGPANQREMEFLGRVHRAFGLDRVAWEHARGGAARERASDGPDAYAVLGLARSASNEEIRLAWRKLMRENHPDSLAARGVPPEFIARAGDKVARINAAWDRIKRERGL
ncbi:MAG: TerB family tellurite resistance protein [Acidisphaera sp.]|nr:TerB family tellurite resistance protein [Acidisphaera sp.]